MLDGASFTATGQRSALATTFGNDAARSLPEAVGRQEAAAGSSDPFGPSVLLPDAVKPVEKSESAAASSDQARSSEGAAAGTEADSSEETDGEGLYELSEEEEAYVEDLAERDAEVRAHENAHASAGGQYAGAPTYSYTTGPDGKQYAVGGSVSIDTSPVNGNPQATIVKMATVVRAALAPAEPSPQDRNVAQQAHRQMAMAQVELAKQQSGEASGETEGADADGSPTVGGSPTDNGSTSGDGSASAIAATTIRDAISAYRRGAAF